MNSVEKENGIAKTRALPALNANVVEVNVGNTCCADGALNAGTTLRPNEIQKDDISLLGQDKSSKVKVISTGTKEGTFS